jgi:competence protein ComGC
VGRKVNGFTLIELVMIVALVVMFSFFLIKLNIAAGNERQQIKTATALLALSFSEAHDQAIAGNTYAKVVVDISSSLKFRRIAIMKQKNNDWISEKEIILPERTFVLSWDIFNECLGDKDLETYTYDEEAVVLQGIKEKGYYFVFGPDGRLFHPATAILGISYGAKVGDEIEIKQNTSICGLFIASTGQGIILNSKDAIKEAI